MKKKYTIEDINLILNQKDKELELKLELEKLKLELKTSNQKIEMLSKNMDTCLNSICNLTERIEKQDSTLNEIYDICMEDDSEPFPSNSNGLVS